MSAASFVRFDEKRHWKLPEKYSRLETAKD